MPGFFAWKPRTKRATSLDPSNTNQSNESSSRIHKNLSSIGRKIERLNHLNNVWKDEHYSNNRKYSDPTALQTRKKTTERAHAKVRFRENSPLDGSNQEDESQASNQWQYPFIDGKTNVQTDLTDRREKSSENGSTNGMPNISVPDISEIVSQKSVRNGTHFVGSLGLAFLQFNDQVKRTLLPIEVNSIGDVKALFIRSFPGLDPTYLDSPHVRIYIQEPGKDRLFYELDDLHDVKDRSVLQIREQHPTRLGAISPTPPTPSSYCDIGCYSESEMDVSNYWKRKTGQNRTKFDQRPERSSSAFSHTAFIPTSTTTMSNRGTNGDADPNFSDSSHDPRSGSVTPVVGKDTQLRMHSMERQLAGLSTLVKSALVNKGTSESVFKDMELMRREILGNPADVDLGSEAGSLGRYSDIGSEKCSSSLQSDRDMLFGSYSIDTVEMRRQLQAMKSQVSDVQGELKHLRRMTQANAHSSQDYLKETFNKIRTLLDSHMQHHELLPFQFQLESNVPSDDGDFHRNRLLINSEQNEHRATIKRTEAGLGEFERKLEEVRKNVIHGDKILCMNEVEQLTRTLTNLGRGAADLKTQFPKLQSRLKRVMTAEMVKVVREEKFLKEEPHRIDQALRRCKKLTNTMVTLKKLAMVQDPKESYNGFLTSNLTIPSYSVIEQEQRSTKEPIFAIEGRKMLKSAPLACQKLDQKPDQQHVLDTLLMDLQIIAHNAPTPSSDHFISDANEIVIESNTMKRNRKSAIESRSISPCSVNSEPSKKPPPPPPPKRCYATLERTSRFTADLKSQLQHERPPLAISQTNALDQSEMTCIKSESSSESVNSQNATSSTSTTSTSSTPSTTTSEKSSGTARSAPTRIGRETTPFAVTISSSARIAYF